MALKAKNDKSLKANKNKKKKNTTKSQFKNK